MGSTRIEFHSSIPAISEEWLRLEKSLANPSIQNDYVLLNAWYACYLAGRKPAFLSLWDGKTCLGLYPFTLERKYGAKVFNTLYHESFSISKPIVAAGYGEFYFRELIRLLQEQHGKWDVLKFSSIYCFEPEAGLLASAFESNNTKFFTIHDRTYVVEIGDSFEEYCQTYLSKKTRENLDRLERKIAKQDSKFVYYMNYEALPHMGRFYEMENTGWKKESGTALLNMKDNLVYSESLIHACCLSGKFFMAFLEIDGVKIAGQYGYIEDGVYNGLRTAYDRDYAMFGPSVILIARTLRLLIDTFPDVKLLNCYPLSYGYKQKYAHDRCECNTHVLFSNNIKGQLLSMAYKIKMSKKATT
ncbi:GNAT family N-acetyltransferase [Desulfovibrio sulfodismutans]|uniref:GNAT family N-acetyltransferase n=1 Tax=Desulfolutivibrio sulfodismutans TaxID=63561 RepID=A0A7K3NL78_9BACT|nr:GNAT family N-acetyltransferase [Desulfolutivibrio sulfodismutans]NDY56535.1 GNAT family N-acetyltransferase [Desulfolutivibrio sulfodismutans]QLA12624.1 GNAT family N-acetyltransferase [Desulfolutivibrio sulfodismutans DSM 3696]